MVEKIILGFDEISLDLVCNKTNLKRIIKVLGPETDLWVGAKVVLGCEWCLMAGHEVKGIRVASVTPAPTGGKK